MFLGGVVWREVENFIPFVVPRGQFGELKVLGELWVGVLVTDESYVATRFNYRL